MCGCVRPSVHRPVIKKRDLVLDEVNKKPRRLEKAHGHIINMQRVLLDEKLREKKWNQFATYISPTNRLANCLWSPNFMQQQKNQKKLQHRSPGILHF